MIRRRLARLLLALALLAGWQAALEHPLRHVGASGALVHLHDGHAHEGGHSDEPGPGALCDALAALTACAPEYARAAVAPAPFADRVVMADGGALRAAEAPPFLSQGPPASV